MLEKQDFSHIAEIVENILDKKLIPIQTDLTELKSDVSELKTDVSGLKTDVSGLKTDVSGLKTDVSDLKADNISLRKEMLEFRKSSEAQTRGINAILTHLLATEDIVNEQIEELQRNVKELNRRTAHLAH